MGMAGYNPEHRINGLYGFLYWEDGSQVASCKEFEVNMEMNKETFFIPGDPAEKNKVVNYSVSGSLTWDKIDSTLQAKIALNPSGKFKFLARLADPTAKGEESVVLSGVSFDGMQIIGWSLEELVEQDADFTVDSFKYTKMIA